MTNVLYDAPGPRARARNMVFNVIGACLVALVAWYVYDRFNQDPEGPATSQWDAEKWKPFLEADTWTNFLLPGIVGTLKAAALAAVLAMAFGLLLAVGRMSNLKAVAWLSASVVELLRSIPLLLMMIFLWLAPTKLFEADANVFLAVVLALMLYNGAVIAEIVRAGVNALPRGQSEAGAAIGLTSGQTMRLILLPQALRAMLPAIIAQLVVLLKDSALGYIIGYSELLRQGNLLGGGGKIIPALIVTAALYIAINMTLSALANAIERRTRRTGHTAAVLVTADSVPPGPGQQSGAAG